MPVRISPKLKPFANTPNCYLLPSHHRLIHSFRFSHNSTHDDDDDDNNQPTDFSKMKDSFCSIRRSTTCDDLGLTDGVRCDGCVRRNGRMESECKSHPYKCKRYFSEEFNPKKKKGKRGKNQKEKGYERAWKQLTTKGYQPPDQLEVLDNDNPPSNQRVDVEESRSSKNRAAEVVKENDCRM
jgi:hypothetical protein